MRGIRLSEPNLPSQTALRLQQEQNLRTQNQMAQQEIQMRQRQAQAQAAEQELMSLSASGDMQALNKLSAINPQAAQGIRDSFVDKNRKSTQLATAFLATPKDRREKLYKSFLTKAQQQGLDVSELPGEYSEEAEQFIGFVRDSGREAEKVIASQQPIKREIRETEQGIVAIDPTTGQALPVTENGQRLQPAQKSPETVVNVGKSETEEAKEIGKIRARRYESVLESGDTARRGLETLQTLKTAVENPETSQGAFSNIRAESKKIVDLFGIKVEGLADDAIISAVGNKLALQLRNPKGEDGGLTGATSDRDIKFLVAGVPGRNKTREQNLALIDISMKDKQRTVKLKELGRQYFDENGTFAGFEKVKEEWLNENPLYEEGSEEKEKIKGMLKRSRKKGGSKIKFLGFE